MIEGWLPSTCCLTEAEASQSLVPQNLVAYVEVGKMSRRPTGSTREKPAGCPHITGAGLEMTGRHSKRGIKMSWQGTRSL